MKLMNLLPLLAMLLLGACSQSNDENQQQAVNGVLGDISFVEQFGHEPTSATDENLRISTHLKYVENLLRQRDVNHLPQEQQKQRERMLDLLHEYRLTGEFPRNYDYPGQRRPCFIDRDGNICAVGYLVEQTAGHATAEAINARYQYASIFEMDLPDLAEWVAKSGLTLRECAMIQPSYGPSSVSYLRPMSKEYAVATSLFIGVNFGLSSLQLAESNTGKIVPIAGLLTGAGQAVMGAVAFPSNGSYYHTSRGQRTFSLVNIGLGSSSFLISGYHLLRGTQPDPDRTTSWNLYSHPLPNEQTAVGVGFTKRL